MSEEFTTTVRVPASMHRALSNSQFVGPKAVVLRRLFEQYAAGELKLNRTKERMVPVGLRGLDQEIYEKACARAKADGVTMTAAITDLLAQFIRDHEETVRAFEQFRGEHMDHKRAA